MIFGILRFHERNITPEIRALSIFFAANERLTQIKTGSPCFQIVNSWSIAQIFTFVMSPSISFQSLDLVFGSLRSYRGI
jgi:hypothetical protein